MNDDLHKRALAIHLGRRGRNEDAIGRTSKGADPSPQRTRSTAIKRIKRKELPHFFCSRLQKAFPCFLPSSLFRKKKRGGVQEKKKGKKGKGGRKKMSRKRERETDKVEAQSLSVASRNKKRRCLLKRDR
ncbi:hypothetical protein CDAR_318541 [Caerostris darwini]|uniref:Uncharacterized protein n=1 Tax=Caerostris darwini TaxID=1538125 RepID=A0AAV4Q9B9_9ARAC|nr:hypothetical protein CDAR_318541 [Caerostris darwini]